MEMILPLLSLLKETKKSSNRNGIRTFFKFFILDSLKDDQETQNLHLIENNNCNENRINQRNSYFEFPNLNNSQSNSNIGFNHNNVPNGFNHNYFPNMNINSDCMRKLSQFLMQIQNTNCNSNFNSLIYNNNNNNNNNTNNNNNNNNLSFNNGNNINYPYDFNSNGVGELFKASNLITELINLEQQNLIQIDLIQKIINNKQKNNNIINNLLLKLLSNQTNEGNGNQEKNEDGTTKSSSRSSEESNLNPGNSNTALNNLEIETLKAAENSEGT